MTTSIDARLRYIEKRPAAKRLQAQVVTTDKLPRAAIVTETIKNLAVVENSIGTNEISTRTIDANAVTNSELNNNAVTNRNITTDAIDARVNRDERKDCVFFHILLLVYKSPSRRVNFTTAVEAAIAGADMVFLSVNTPTKTKGVGAGQASDLR